MSEPAIPSTWSEARGRVLPVIRRVTEPAHAWYAELANARNRVLARPFVPFLHELVVLDLEAHRVMLNLGVVEDWGVPPDTVFRTARENLAARATRGLQRRPEYGGLWQANAGDRYESARLLLEGFLGAFADSVPGRPVAIIPAPRVLLVGGEGSNDQLDTLIELASKAFEATSSPLSPVLYTLEAGRVVPWRPGPELRDAFGTDATLLSAWLAAHEYSRQAEHLADNPHVDAVIAEVDVLEDREPPATLARWCDTDAFTLLPVVDRVEITADGDTFEVTWSSLWREARGCLEETRLEPTRYRARWPMPATVERLRKLALSG